MFRPPRGAEHPSRGVRTPLSLLGRVGLGVGPVWGATCGFPVSTSPSTGVVGSADALRCPFCLCPANPAENSEHVVLSPITSVQARGSMELGLPPVWTQPQWPRPLRPDPAGSVGSTPYQASRRTVRPWNRQEFSFLLFPNQDTFVISACFRML